MKTSGSFSVRIEDTDADRSTQEFAQGLVEDLTWLGLLEKGTSLDDLIKQSDRSQLYDQQLESLLQSGDAYRCFCTEQDLALARQVAKKSKLPPRYSGICRRLSEEKIQENLQANQPFVLRFKVPTGVKITYDDQVRGERTTQSDHIGDFVIARSNGVCSFLFSNAIDDSLTNIDMALRGEDHLANTPSQILLLDALKLNKPNWGHVSFIVQPDGRPMSKRDGISSLRGLREQGYLALAIHNCLFRLGNKVEDRGLLSMKQMASLTDLRTISPSPVRWDPRNLDHWQEQAVRALSASEFRNWLASCLPGQDFSTISDENLTSLYQQNITLPNQAAEISQWMQTGALSLSPQAKEIIQQEDSALYQQILQAFKEVDFEQMPDNLAQLTQRKGRQLFLPIRLALTGVKWGADLPAIIKGLGKQTVQERLEQALGLSQQGTSS